MEDDFSNNDLRKEGIDSKSDLDKSKTGKNTSKVVYFILNSIRSIYLFLYQEKTKKKC